MKTSWSTLVLRGINVLLVLCFGVILYIHFVSPISFTLGGVHFSASGYTKPFLLIVVLWLAKHLITILTRPHIARNEMTWYYLGICIIAGATLLMEVTMTRIFSVAFFHHFAFLIISTALFGFGFSGVFLSIFPSLNKFDFNKLLTTLSICFAVSTLITLKVVVDVPLQFGRVLDQSFEFFAYLSVYYLALAIPFFFSGMVIALLLSHIPNSVNKLYFANMLGAGIGCFLVIPLIPSLGAPGTVIATALLGIVASACFAKLIGRHAVVVSAVCFIIIALLLPYRSTHFRVKVHEGKRSFNVDEERGRVEFTQWGPISRIDVASMPNHPHKIIWIDGGSNQSFMVPFSGDLRTLEPDRRAGIVYRLVENPDVLTVGPAGGEEVLYALSWRPNSIIGVELDPVIVDIVQNEYRAFIGGIYNKPHVKLINDEGRSYIRHSPQKFDIIQQINNASPVAIASGAVNLSETYLITVEAFHDYLDHLKEGGFIFIRRWGAIRLATVAAQALRERGVEHPEKQIVIMDDPLHNFGGGQFYLKNGEFTEAEIAEFQPYIDANAVLYGPESFNVKHPEYEKYRKLVADPEGWKIYDNMGINVFPVTDDKPFFNHFKKFAHFSLENIPPEFHPIFAKYNNSDFSLLAILVEAAALSIIFIILPLYIFKRSGLRARGKFRFMVYFFSLGLAFILIEIVLIQKFTLFMGNPTYSVTVVLFSILTAAGFGSFLSGKFRNNLKGALFTVVLGIVFLSWLELTFSPIVFKAFLGYSMPVRVFISILLITPLGLLMGMPFPLGITLTNQVSNRLIPWVWGINGYATVIGSVLCVILALSFGFKVVMLIACGIYLIGMLTVLGVKA
ncbi:hypothetical protein GF339_05065 [candidate division KSB3 bacterium]|uniref:SAM-dependent methyltransferase n=1 Tax=candidate division KSB3 bacterium TaxID=2044937 RepID=A0A9D5JTX6_9BACT|nr:hypothetical protein [candidate division KSB3 bacterium]MBD3323931.1 hypothetical protein [candidate division KSB3 bacterium]